MTAGRSVGQRIRQACEILETHGPMGSTAVCDYMQGVDKANVGQFCKRAARLGMMTVQQGLGHRGNYSIYTVVSNWRESAEPSWQKRPPKAAPKPRFVTKQGWAMVNSVFGMSA